MFDTLSGGNDYSIELVESLLATGQVDLTILTVESSRLSVDTLATVLRQLPDFGASEPRRTKLRKLLGAYASFWRVVASEHRWSVVHVQFFKFAWIEAPLLLALRAMFGARIVFTAHNALPHVRKAWHACFYRWWYGQIDVLHVLSANVEREIRQSLGAKPRQVARIEHGSYRGLWRRFGGNLSREQARTALGLADGGFVILQYGLFREYKGLDTLIRAFCALPRDMDARLLLAGGGYPHEIESWRAIARDAGCLDRVRWLDRFVSDEELTNCLQAADLAVFPYRHISQSGALILAMTFGVPCVASDIPGFREALPEYEDCFFPRNDSDGLAARIEALARDRVRLDRLRAVVREQARLQYDWDGIAKRFVALYRSLDRRQSDRR